MPIPATQLAGLANGVNGSMKVKSSNNLKKLFTKAFRSAGVKSIFKSKAKRKPPAEVVRRVRFLLEAVDSLDDDVDRNHFDKVITNCFRNAFILVYYLNSYSLVHGELVIN